MEGIPMADKTYDGPPEMALKPGYEYYANFVTEKGPVKVGSLPRRRPRPSITSSSSLVMDTSMERPSTAS
jgi:hypothetical protein